MSVQYILDNTYSYVENEKLNPNIDVSGSLKAPVHYIDDLTLSKTLSGNLSIGAPIVEATQFDAPIAVLDTINTEILIPKAGEGSDIAVLGNIDVSGNGLKNVSSLTIPSSSAVAGYVLKSTDTLGSLEWAPDATADVEQWATYKAVQNVDMSQNDIVNADSITSTFVKTDVLDCANPSGTQINVAKNLNLSSNTLYAETISAGNTITSANAFFGVEPNRWTGAESYTLKQLDGNNQVQSDSGADLIGWHDVQSKRGKFYATDASDVEKFSATGDGLVTATSINCSDYNGTAGNEIGIYPAEDAKVVSVWGQLLVRQNNLGVNDGYITTQQLIPQYKPERTLWVSANNTYAGPNGSYENPYTTIQDAINYAESVYDNTYWYINVLAGTYAGFTVTKKVFIRGCAPSNPDSASVGCQINSGSIIISVDSNDGDMFNNQVSISNFLIAGVEIECNSGNTARSVLSLTDCYLYQDSGSSGRMIHYNPDAADGRLWLSNCRIVNQSTTGLNPVIEISKGMLKMGLCVVSGSGSQNILKLSGTSRIDSVVLCSFTSSTSSTTAPAIVECASSGSLLTFSQCAFIYSNSANKSSSSTSTGVLLSSATVQPTLIVTYNSFFLAGTSSANNFAIQDANFGNARQAIILYFSNNASLNNASQIRGSAGVSKFSLQAVA